MSEAIANRSYESSSVHSGSALLTDESFLSDLRNKMLSFARLQLRDDAMAEDVVQEAFSGALVSVARFERRAALNTWVFAILKNKIADSLRKAARYVDADAISGESSGDGLLGHLFDQSGHWHDDTVPRGWAKPDDACGNGQFWRVFDVCLENLPPEHARLFMMREMLDLETKEILAATGVSQSNLNVSLYRARMRLRECLSNRWFETDGGH